MVWERTFLQRFRSGDRATLGEVFRRYAPGLMGALRGAAFSQRGFAVVQSTAELENVVLEVFARAFEPRARETYDGLRPFEQYLFGIGRNHLLELIRARVQGARLEQAIELTQALELDAPQTADVAAEDREVQELLAQFRAGLTDDEQKLFDLRMVEGKPQEDAAPLLGMTRIQLRRREFALKSRLLQFLKARGYLRNLTVRGWSFETRKAGT